LIHATFTPLANCGLQAVPPAPDDAAEELELEAEPFELPELLDPVPFELPELLDPVLFELAELLDAVLFELSELLELEPFDGGAPDALEAELVALALEFVPPVEEDSDDSFDPEALDCDALVLDDDSEVEGGPFWSVDDPALQAAMTMPPNRNPILR
jgi:hypothetical protein